MSQLKWLPVILITALFVSPTQAEPIRTFYSVENQFPRWEQLEVGLDFTTTDRGSDFIQVTTHQASVYARYGLLDNLAVSLAVPFVQLDPDLGDSESGLGDIEVSVQLRAYEDIFGYPYFIPYATVSLPTGDDDNGLGLGDVAFTGGIAYGSRINDWIDWTLDLSYKVNSDDDNQFKLGHSYVWNVSDDFAILTEVAFQQARQELFDDEFLIAGGFNYNWTPDFEMGVSVAVGTDDTDVEAKARISYSF